MDQDELKVKIAFHLEHSCYSVAKYLFKAAVQVERLGFSFARYSLKQQQKDPTLEQWINRLIEFIDTQYIILAYQYFCNLVSSGLRPEEAFAKTIGAEHD